MVGNVHGDIRLSRAGKRNALVFAAAVPILAALAIVLPARVAGQEAGRERAAGDGLALYVEAGCVACHGADGRGSASGPSIVAPDLTPHEFVEAVRRPVRTMPAFPPQALSDVRLSRIYDYFRAQGAPPVVGGRADVGARLFASYGCYSCHANEAQGGMHGPRLGPEPITFARFSWYVRHPTRTMPPYSTMVVSDQDVADIYAFVEAQPAPPPVGSIPLLAP